MPLTPSTAVAPRRRVSRARQQEKRFAARGRQQETGLVPWPLVAEELAGDLDALHRLVVLGVGGDRVAVGLDARVVVALLGARGGAEHHQVGLAGIAEPVIGALRQEDALV